MPRISAVDCTGCPPLRVLSFDVLGLVKVIEVRGEKGTPEVVEKWGQPDSERSILATSLSAHTQNPRLGIGRKHGVVEILDPTNGTVYSSCEIGSTEPSKSADGRRLDNDHIVGLHVFGRNSSNKFFVCTEKGNAIIRSFEEEHSHAISILLDSPRGWKICGSGSVSCCQVDGSEKYVACGGKGIEVNTWDLEKATKLWTAKAPPRNSMDLFAPTWVTAVTFLNKDDHRKIVIGTCQHEVRLYDIAAQRRPTLSFSFQEHPIKVVEEDLDGYTVYVGTGSGDMASFDMRTGKILGSFKGKCSGSIRSIVRHPELPLIASCGLDRYLRIWDAKTRQLLASAYLKQQLISVIIDCNFIAAKPAIDKEATDVNLDKIECDINNVDDIERNKLSAGSKRKSSKRDEKKHKAKVGRDAKVTKKSKIKL
ncbi:hypothetical protein SUGI_0747520 [Cryptomeria japonica]|uniref:uncharacterized protein LOC131031111 n=1 Tax=Cryptomeria japonica TaxID=3369 RepID=UPI002414B84B|nr:uncharacterized protein LOC131031111 [Cryptomeria japonica]GLJ36952.1 hypothetical protein SUGI_0747520 [Cryptomeria japonica]